MDELNLSSVASEESVVMEPPFYPSDQRHPTTTWATKVPGGEVPMDDRPLNSPTPVEEVSEISQLRHQLNEKNLLIIESRVAKDRAIQDLHSTMQKNLVELATTKSELRRLKRARPLHRNDGHSFANTGGRSFRATPAPTQGRKPNYTDYSAGENDASHYSTSSSTSSSTTLSISA